MRAIGRSAARGALVVLFLAGLGCDDATRATHEDPPPVVGPSPLRRLSNNEVTFALADLFPTVRVDVPKLPNDTVVAGFENAAEAQKPSDVLVARLEAIATLYAREATRTSEDVHALVGCEWDTPSKADACATYFLATMGLRLFRRPLTPDEADRLSVKLQAWRATIDFEAAISLTLSSMLQSPQFLYRAEPEPAGEAGTIVAVEPYAMASRLSFFLWESVPDQVLLEAAKRDELRTVSELRAQAERMLSDSRARRVYWSFHRQWLGLDRILDDEHAARTPEIDAAWTPATALSARHESRLFIENVLAGGGTFAELIESRRAWVDLEMARIYGAPTPDGAKGAFVEVLLPERERAGILTRVAFLASTSHRGGTSPPIRGNAIQLRMLCQADTPPPDDADLSPPATRPGEGPRTTRALFEARTSPAACKGCHIGLNGFGFGFERYSASGAHRSFERGLPVDARGTIVGTDVDADFDGPLALSAALAKSRAVRGCATIQWMRYALGRSPTTDELATADALTSRSMASGGQVRALLVDLVTSPSFRLRRIRGTR